MEALRRSVQAGKRTPPQAQEPPKKGKKRVAGQTEMLLPIKGERPAREAAKKPARSSARQKKAG